MKILRARLFEKKQSAQDKEMRETRQSQVGMGDRSEKIRTYNYPQNRVTDHRVGLTLKKLDLIIEGNLEEIIKTLKFLCGQSFIFL